MSYAFNADLGGQPGHGPVPPEAEGEFWHEAFDPTALALTLAMGAPGAWNIDQSRAARETLPDYADLTYYRIWLAALERLMTERGLVEPSWVDGRLLQIVAALKEAGPELADGGVEAMKKEALVTAAASRLAGTRWLPEPLRRSPG